MSDTLNMAGWTLDTVTGEVSHDSCEGSELTVVHGKEVCSICGTVLPAVMEMALRTVEEEFDEDSGSSTIYNHGETQNEENDEMVDTEYDEEICEEEPIAAEPTVARGGKLIGSSLQDESEDREVKPSTPAAEPDFLAAAEAMLSNPEFKSVLTQLLGSEAPAKEARVANPGSDKDLNFEVLDSSVGKKGFCEIKFNQKPSEETRAILKGGQFRWNGKTQRWYGNASLLASTEMFGTHVAAFVNKEYTS